MNLSTIQLLRSAIWSCNEPEYLIQPVDSHTEDLPENRCCQPEHWKKPVVRLPFLKEMQKDWTVNRVNCFCLSVERRSSNRFRKNKPVVIKGRKRRVCWCKLFSLQIVDWKTVKSLYKNTFFFQKYQLKYSVKDSGLIVVK